MFSGKNLFIHIGYPKTGTTTLQEYLFRESIEILYLRNAQQPITWEKDVFFLRELSFRDRLAKYHDEILCSIKALEDEKKKIALISQESFTSFSMFFRFEPYPCVRTIDPSSIARKLHLLFAKASQPPKIIVTIRRQDEMMLSMYAQVYNLVFKRFKATKQFSKFLKYSFDHEYDFMLDAINYNRYISYYQELFGKENVKILVYEKLRKAPQSFFEELLDYMGIHNDYNLSLLMNKPYDKRSSPEGYQTDTRSLDEILAYYKQRYSPHRSINLPLSLKKIIKKIKLSADFKSNIQLQDIERDKILNFFRHSNQILDQANNLNLDKYGYF